MAECDLPNFNFNPVDGSIDVSEYYIKLMQDTLSDDSLYTRAKETLFHQFEDLQLNEKEKASLASQFISGMTTELSKVSMGTALQWAKEERDAAYALAKLKADAETALAQTELVSQQICKMEKEIELVCAQITATLSGTIRENGIPIYEAGSDCKVIGLEDNGLKYYQTKQIEASMYQIQADAFRKSGVVKIDTDTDGIEKGISGTMSEIDGLVAGYTAQQTFNAERQRIAYEDSKVNHAANSSASMIGQLLSSETFSSENEQDVDRWRAAIDRLLRPNNTTPNP